MSSSSSQKRPADTATPPLPPTTTAPLILRRHHHRRRNIASQVWGLEAPPPPARHQAPQTPFPPLHYGTTRPFNIYKSLLRHPNLFFQFALRLPYELITALYAIDKEFHYRLNLYSVSLLHDYAAYHAPLHSRIFSWALYPDLCISDPQLRPMDGRAWLARDVPGFRWVGMVLWRQKVVRGVLTRMAGTGRVPAGMEGVLAKFWCLMECRRGGVREAFLRDRNVWADGELVLCQLFFVKLDMYFSDPVLGNGIGELAHILLTQKGLGVLYGFMMGERDMDYDQATDMLVRTYPMEELDTDTHTWLDDELDNGIPEEEWGLLCKDGWHVDGERMDSAVDMVIMEGIRRGLDVHKYYLEFVMFGFVDGRGENIPVPRLLRSGNTTKVVECGYPTQQTLSQALTKLEGLAGATKADHMEVDG